MNYSFEIVPGPSYQMGTVHFDGAPDAMAVRPHRYLEKMAPGQPFDESYVSTFAARAQSRTVPRKTRFDHHHQLRRKARSRRTRSAASSTSLKPRRAGRWRMARESRLYY